MSAGSSEIEQRLGETEEKSMSGMNHAMDTTLLRAEVERLKAKYAKLEAVVEWEHDGHHTRPFELDIGRGKTGVDIHLGYEFIGNFPTYTAALLAAYDAAHEENGRDG